MSLPSLTRWNASTETAVRNSHIRRAFRNAAEGSIATTDPSLPEGEDFSVGDSVVAQVEEGGGSIGPRGSSLNLGS